MIFDERSSDNEVLVMVTLLCCVIMKRHPEVQRGPGKTAPSQGYKGYCSVPQLPSHHHTAAVFMYLLNFIALVNNLHVFNN